MKPLRIESARESDDVLFVHAHYAGIDDLTGFDLGELHSMCLDMQPASGQDGAIGAERSDGHRS